METLGTSGTGTDPAQHPLLPASAAKDEAKVVTTESLSLSHSQGCLYFELFSFVRV